jgi:hypothetical protein
MVRNSITLKACLLLSMIGVGLYAQEMKVDDLFKKRNHSANEVKLIEVTDEFPCDAGATVFIGNTIRRVTVLTTHEKKVRLVTTVAYEGKSGYTNEDWLAKLELKVSGTAGNVNVKCGNMQPMDSREIRSDQIRSLRPSLITPGRPHRTPDLPQRQRPNDLTPNGTVVFDSKGNWLYKDGNIRRNIIVYVPAGSKLDIDSRYAEIILDSNIREVNARLMSGSMTMKDADRLVLTSTYGSMYASNIGHAEVELIHGWFHAKDVSTLDINSKTSTVELGVLGHVKINSNDDQYEMEEAGVITGGKNYGSIRINTLRNSMDLTGVNADIKVHNIEPGVSVIKIDGQYADLRLPVDNLKDYTVNFEGRGSNLYTPFERLHSTDSSFNVKVGTGKKNSFQLKCSNCTVDMK